MKVEAHCHSIFSVDGYDTPEKVVDAAAHRGVDVLALTDHNHLGGIDRARVQAIKRSIRLITGVELDSYWGDVKIHVLAFGFDSRNEALRRLIRNSYLVYTEHFELLLKGFDRLGFAVDREELQSDLQTRYPEDVSAVLNQWHARDFLIRKGTFENSEHYRETVNKILNPDGSPDAHAYFKDFNSFEDILKAVHKAGGVLLLAHVSHYFPGNEAEQISFLYELMEQGMDGFELYHPRNIREAHFASLVYTAGALNCLISGGSDSHSLDRNFPYPLGNTEIPEKISEKVESLFQHNKDADS